MKCFVSKLCSDYWTDQRWQDELLFLIWRFFEQFAFVKDHLLCYWSTIHNSISKICPKFQVLRSHFFEVGKPLRCPAWWAMCKNCAKWKYSTPIYVECDKIYRRKVCVQEFLYFVPGLDIQPEQSKTDNPARNNAVAGCETLRLLLTVLFSRLTQTHGLEVKVSRSESGDSGSILVRCWNSLLPVCHFATPPDWDRWQKKEIRSRPCCLYASNVAHKWVLYLFFLFAPKMENRHYFLQMIYLNFPFRLTGFFERKHQFLVIQKQEFWGFFHTFKLWFQCWTLNKFT